METYEEVPRGFDATACCSKSISSTPLITDSISFIKHSPYTEFTRGIPQQWHLVELPCIYPQSFGLPSPLGHVPAFSLIIFVLFRYFSKFFRPIYCNELPFEPRHKIYAILACDIITSSNSNLLSYDPCSDISLPIQDNESES